MKFNKKSFTLLEVLLCAFLLCLIGSALIFSFIGLLNRQPYEQKQELLYSLRIAKYEAMNSGQRVVFEYSTNLIIKKEKSPLSNPNVFIEIYIPGLEDIESSLDIEAFHVMFLPDGSSDRLEVPFGTNEFINLNGGINIESNLVQLSKEE